MNITNDLITEYINGFYRPVNDELAKLREIGERDRVPIILKETEVFLASVLALKKPKKILEIGTAIGYSALFFQAVCPNAEIHTIEKDENAFESAKHNIRSAGKESNIKCYIGDGQEQIEKIRDQGIHGFDFIFIDASKSHYKRFLETALEVAGPEALIVSDNILQKGMTVSEDYDTYKKHKTNIKKMREYVEFISNDRRLYTSLMSVGDGIAVSIYRG